MDELDTSPAHARSASIGRRQLIGRATVAGAVWTAPIVFDSFASPAAAATCPPAFNSTAPSTGYTWNVPANSVVSYTISGGGGGGATTNGGGGGGGAAVVQGPGIRLIAPGGGGGGGAGDQGD
ncbi:MAG: hypothetical protein KDB24_16065, partial [Microthrixaceae bacterium]|nr:hypothetical protein [Microthrixaceae bacterium]